MKKLLLRYKSFGALAFLGLLAVACGLEFTTITLDNHEPEQGSVIKVTADLQQISDNNAQNLYMLFAARVPADWSGKSVNAETGDAKFSMVECESYAAFCEFCFPRDGYKWVAFQTETTFTQGNTAHAEAELIVGEALGEYNIDLLVGGWKKEPADLIKDNGDINLDLAFGNNVDFSEAVMSDGKVAYHSSEYLMIAGTITDAEYAARREAISAIYTTNAYGNGVKPVVPDVVNRNTTQNLTVNVKESAGIEGVSADVAEGAVEYFNLQGVRVENPETGLYIRRQGNVATKVYVK